MRFRSKEIFHPALLARCNPLIKTQNRDCVELAMEISFLLLLRMQKMADIHNAYRIKL